MQTLRIRYKSDCWGWILHYNFLHRRMAELGQMDRRPGVGLHRMFELPVAEVGQPDRLRATHVVDQDVDVTELGDDGLVQPLELLIGRHVGGHGDTTTPRRLDLLLGRLQRGNATRGNRDVGAVLCEGQRNRAPDTLGTARNQGDLALEREIYDGHLSPLCGGSRTPASVGLAEVARTGLVS
jgi:hypothetical protein